MVYVCLYSELYHDNKQKGYPGKIQTDTLVYYDLHVAIMHLITIRIKWFWHFFLQSYHLRCSQLEISRTYILFLTNFVLSTIKTRAHGLQLKKMSHYSKRLQVFERMVTKLWVVEGFIDARGQCLIFSQDVTSDLCAATPAWSKLIFLDVTLVMQCNTSMMTI